MQPFVFGKITNASDFVNRKNNINQLTNNFLSGTNTILLSPRRWGKSSLVERVADLLSENKNLVICKIDLFNIRSEDEFYHTLANEVITKTSTKWEDAMRYTKAFLSQLLPKISFSTDNETSLSFGVEFKELKKNANEILDLAEKIAEKKAIKIVVCIDEFQNIAYFDKTNDLQKKMRSYFQKHKNVSYCFYGSKRHMLLDVFTNTSMPFYKFGDIMFLEKIKTEEWVPFIQKKFKNTGKKINKQQAETLVHLVENHSYYVQQLAQQVWLRTSVECSMEIVMEAHQSLSDQLSLLFVNITETLSTMQLNFLKALLCDEEHFSSQEILSKYQLGTSGNVNRLKKALQDKDIIEILGKTIEFHDPIYKFWLKTTYFKLT